MKEQAKDGMSLGGIIVSDGWHTVEVVEGIDYAKDKDGHIVQTEKGSKIWKVPMKVVESNDEASIGGIVNASVFEQSGGNVMATILEAAGLWAGICEAFPGDDVSVFESRIMDKVKSRLPGKSFKVETKIDKNGFPRPYTIASFKKFKEIEKDLPAKAPAAAANTQGTKAAEPAKAPGSEW